jgi:hypothetical protein
MPSWLRLIATGSLLLSGVCSLAVAIDVFRRPQTMWIMDVVWPVTALWSGPLGLGAYWRWGRAGSKRAIERAKAHGEPPPGHTQPLPVLTLKAATHCGSGCTLGDILAECLIAIAPFTLFGKPIFGAWVYDFVLAYVIGVVFQYFTIKPMRDLSLRKGVVAAIKADTASLVAWQVGMYGWMAIATFVLFQRELPKASPVFWFMMQIAMLVGFLTAYPVNWWLIQRGVKEKM